MKDQHASMLSAPNLFYILLDGVSYTAKCKLLLNTLVTEINKAASESFKLVMKNTEKMINPCKVGSIKVMPAVSNVSIGSHCLYIIWGFKFWSRF